MLFDVTYGKENFPDSACQMWIFLVPLAGPGEPRRQELHLFAAAKEPGSNIRKMQRAGADAIPASTMGNRELGTWSDNRFDVPEGTILKLFATRKMSWSGLQNKAVLYLRAREQAALRQIRFATTRKTMSSRHDIEAINGRFDILTPGDVAAMGGIPLSPALQPAANPASVQALLTFREIAPELAATAIQIRTTVENTEGERVVVATSKRRRILED